MAVNGKVISAAGETLGRDQLMFGKYVLLRRGKRTYHLIKVGQ